MSSSLQNERCKGLLILSVVVILVSTIKPASAIDLVDLPLIIPSKSANIHATLTDANGANKYFMQESISASGPSIKGKIVISSEKDSYNIYYNNDSSTNNKRLVIHGTNCSPFTYTNNWDQTLPGINKPVLNLVLLMGPSILYRLGHHSLVWKSVEDKEIRGTMMKGVTTEMNKRLKITYYYKKHFTNDSAIKSPSRIEFSGNDPSTIFCNFNETLILDIYHQNEKYYDEFANEVQPLPGIGCPYYLTTFETLLPSLKANYLHFTMYEHVQGSNTTQTYSQIHVSRHLLRLKATLLGVTTRAIYDYGLGVSYLFQDDGSCRILSGDLNSPGVSSSGYFSLQSLFFIDSSFKYKYFGKLNLEHRSEFPVDAWETVRYNVTINGKKVDKAVITQYFAQSRKSDIFFYGYTLVSTTIAIYKLDSTKKTYTLTDGITRDYMNFGKGSEDEFRDIFSLKECKNLFSGKKLTLGFKLQREGDYSPLKLNKSDISELKKDFIYSNILSKTISRLRIDNVQYNLYGTQIIIEVTFLDSPNLKNIFNSKTMSISEDTFEKMKTIKANSEFECLDELSKHNEVIVVVIYRPSDSFCGYLRNFNDLKEDTKTGKPVSIYHFSLYNLRRINQEIPLDQIHKTYLQDVGNGYFFIGEDNLNPFILTDVIDKTKNEVTSVDGLQSYIRVGAKLKNNGQVTVTVPDVVPFADCYRTCHDSEQLKCNTFSFCQNGECRVSSISTEDSYNESLIEQDKTCSIYALNVLNDYSEVRERKFKTQTPIAVDKSLYSCAESCHASPDCKSFQYCDNSCSFGGFYTDAATEYDEECSVYFPKVSEKYQKTGNKIVSDVMYTEMNLNLDKCASLCHGWSDGDIGCKSFNYCPKSRTESSCSLTKFSVKSSNIKTIEGGDCSNYELNVESNGEKRKESSSTEVTKGTSGSDTFDIIMFLFISVVFGFAAPLC